jgi:twitching motility protein PilT
MNDSTPLAVARAGRQQPGYVAEALKALIQTQVPIKEIHIASGEPLNYRSPEGYRILNEARVVGDEDIHQLMHFAADGRYDPLRRMQDAKQYDEALTCLDHRLRCNFYKESGRLAASIRCLPSSPWAYESLGGPMQLTHVVDRYTSGLILVTGPMGSGKSSTLAALLSHINRHRSCHILTLEDPIEYVLKSDRSRISQRQVGIDVASFADGLLGAKRQHADVILVGELRDTATVKTALQAAEAGSLVFASTHSDNAAGTIEALFSYFRPEELEQVRATLASTLRAILSQKLLSSIDRKRFVLAYEYLPRNPALVRSLRDNKLDMIRALMRDGSGQSDGTTSLNANLKSLVDGRLIDMADAVNAAYEKGQLAEYFGLAAEVY